MAMRTDHTPPPPGSTRARCPVCREAVYSRSGIHPQCAVRQSELNRPKAVPADVAAESEPAAGPEILVAEPSAVAIIEPAPAAPARRRRG
ncbi:hypothetical protein TA3x_002424 [Tundrisphaera sp. TA3]|uniref:hypothetical protein n=1 Tax=Tundrisphaera sp. TA3 TaxID=3435775 RepID=UPI003EBF760C